MLTLIAAVSADGFISAGKGVPWNLPRDKGHFRNATRDQWLLLGRRTYQEMLGWFQGHHPLVLTRDEKFKPPVGEAVSSIAQALRMAAKAGARKLFVCGGSETYAAAMPQADRLILTHVDAVLGSGLPFPAISQHQWQVVSQQHFPADTENPCSMVFATYQRVQPALNAK